MNLVNESCFQPQEPDRLLRGSSAGLRRRGNMLVFVLAVWAILSAVWLINPARRVAGATRLPAALTIDYPLNGSVFPPDIAAPTFEWRDPAENAANWKIDIVFSDGSPDLRMAARGERMKIGEIDSRCISTNN